MMSFKPAYLDMPSACNYVALGKTAIQTLVRRGEFPKPRKLSEGRVAYLVRELDEWAEARPVSDLLPPPNTGRKGLA